MSQLIERFTVWIQIFTSLSVIAGFGLVVWQLQLTRATAIDQYALLNISDASADLNSIYGENAADVLAKACFTPEEMSNADLIVLHAFFSNKVYRVLSIFWQGEFAGWELWKGPASAELDNILMYPQGAAYLKGVSLSGMPALAQLIDEALVEAAATPCNEVLDRMRTD